VIGGVDLGTRLVTICELDHHGSASLRNLRVPGSLDSLQAARALAVLATQVRWPGVVWVERPYGAHIRSVADLSRVYGAILAAIPADHAVSEISAPEWKKAIGLPGNAKKSSVIAWAKTEYGLDLDEHQADALAIAHACRVSSERVARLIAGASSPTVEAA
jgi:Holliday junction resolvasome RuvABC endonuclease subunit